MKRVLAAVALLALGFAAGTLVPRARAGDSIDDVVRELRQIRDEITSIRRAVERRR